MTFAMNFHFAGPTNLPFVTTSGEQQKQQFTTNSTAVDPASGRNCQECLRTALGCGSAPNLGELQRCQAVAKGVQVAPHHTEDSSCTLQQKLYSPFLPGEEEAAWGQCARLCAPDPELQYGAGFDRPFLDDSSHPRGATL